jgi:hypothetical protein
MKNSAKFACTITPSNPSVALSFKILIDETVIYENQHVSEVINFTHELIDDEQEHELRFVMSNKTDKDTKIDEKGEIISDAMLSISDVTFDDISVEMIIIDNAVYGHDFNGTRDPVKDRFYGDMGCNGTVTLKFSTPIYLWLLENM